VVGARGTQDILKVSRLPGRDVLDRGNIRGVVFDLRVSSDFACDDPDAGVMVVMQSPANWWMVLGEAPLGDAGEWKTYRFGVESEAHIKALPTALNVIFVLRAGEPARGSIYLDRIGFLVR
jgi:hypothetical protein